MKIIQDDANAATLEDLEKTITAGTLLPFDEYQKAKEPAINVIINDYAAKLVAAAKEKGQVVTMDEAREMAKKEIPAAFVPEWMKNLRISANISGTELCYLEGIKTSIDRLAELMEVCWEDKIDDYVARHAKDFSKAAEKDKKINSSGKEGGA